jgi:uncharacterized membrane protein YgdD (TMEM256/DUF423 family)
MRPNLLIVGILGATAVALGALGAHALKEVLNPTQLESFKTGVLYHILHTLFLGFVFLLYLNNTSKRLKLIFNLVFWGIILFSGSIYFLNLRYILNAEFLKFLGPITPIGGVLFIAGWILLAFESKTIINSKNE